MKTISVADLKSNPSLYEEIAHALGEDGLVIFPGFNAYRLAVNALSAAAVQLLHQAKRRAQNKPSLVFIRDPAQLDGLVASVPEAAQRLIQAFWPGPLTLRLAPSEDLPGKIRKALGKATGKIGVRVPGTEVGQGIVRAFDQPLLISSANRTKKAGAQSLAQVRKNFGNAAQLLIDNGDLPPAPPSTVVDITTDGWKLVREGAITDADLRGALDGQPA